MNVAISFATSETADFASLLSNANPVLWETDTHGVHKDHSTDFKTMQFNFYLFIGGGGGVVGWLGFGLVIFFQFSCQAWKSSTFFPWQ